MEAYAEVLKYFHELSMGCQAAIKWRSKMIIYDYNLDRRSHEINYKTVQISITTHLYVMGETMQFINSTTGDVIKEKKLERDVIDWHFNCNLLECFQEIVKHGHLLSVGG